MFDPNLTRESALASIDCAGSVSKQVEVDPQVIALCREASERRNHCFASEENYRQHWPRLDKLLAEFLRKFMTTAPFAFLNENLHVYLNAGVMQRRYAKQIFFDANMAMNEAISNAMAQTDTVNVSMSVSKKGFLWDIQQGQATFDPAFLQGLREKAKVICERLALGTNIERLQHETRAACKEIIGYEPPGLERTNGLPYRGNGIANMLTNDVF